VRELSRYRQSLLLDRTRAVNRLQKILQDANIKLASVATDVLGLSARQMLEHLRDGEADPAVLAALAHGKLRKKQAQLEQALTGRVKAHHRLLLTELLAQIDDYEVHLEHVSADIAQRLAAYRPQIEKLDRIPGVNQRVAEIMLAEFGMAAAQFPSAKQVASWAGVCPGNNESAGKRKSGATRGGNPWLRQALIEAAHGAARTKESYLAAQYRRIAARRGSKKALMAVAHSILVIAWHLLTEEREYEDLGRNYFDERAQQAVVRNAVRRLERLGYQVTLTAPPAA
jgi:transposase